MALKLPMNRLWFDTLISRHSGLEPESSQPRLCAAKESFAIKDLITLDIGTRPV
ncbi:hypothetical protein [Rhizobium sp. BK251]|uniref:hypothetical protein n=1 Tax=Rhizobium sp. BK251 TaxID=2512125 RepID=UPI0014055585|nr:hypothetical protein [Rhizobium sp. BK251]